MIAYFKSEIPFVYLVLFFGAGITFSIVFNLLPNPIWIAIWLLLFFPLFGLSIYYKANKIYLKSHYVGLGIYIQMFLSGLIFCNQDKEIYNSNHFSKSGADQLIVTLLEEPKIKGDIARFKVAVENNIQENKITVTSGNLLLAMRFDTTINFNYHYGDVLLIKAKFQDTETAYNPAEFNYKRYLSFQQVYQQSFINQKQTVKIDSGAANPLRAFALKFRQKQVEKFNTYLNYNDSKSVAATLILGYRTDLSQDILEAYSKTGTMHVLSVSGMHVAIVAILLNFLLRFMSRNRKAKIIKTILIIALVWFYAFIAGFAPSVERAAIMITFVMIAQARARKVNIFNVIAIAAFILLLSDPFNIINVGFQLSFIAVCGLIYLQPKIYAFYAPENKIIKFFWSIISVSIAAQIATAPISLYYFHQFPVYFIISNVFIVVPATVIMYLGIGFLLTANFETIAVFLGKLLDELIKFTNNGLFLIEQIDHANITQVWLSIFEITLFYCFLFSILLLHKSKNYLKLAMLFLGIFIINRSYNEFKHVKQKQATFFSLRKNTAIALIKGESAVVITDLDTLDYTYQFSVKPYLDSCQIQSIAYINPHLQKDEKIVNFEGHQLKIINHQQNNFAKSDVDWLLLSGDKNYDLAKINATNHYKHLFIDGKNRDFVIRDLQAQLINQEKPSHTLKRNYAIEIKLN